MMVVLGNWLAAHSSSRISFPPCSAGIGAADFGASGIGTDLAYSYSFVPLPSSSSGSSPPSPSCLCCGGNPQNSEKNKKNFQNFPNIFVANYAEVGGCLPHLS